MVNRAQTATEYLIITAIVIIIALSVVNILVDIPSFGSGSSSQLNRATLASQQIAVTDFAVSDYATSLIIQNNYLETVFIESILINDNLCLFFLGVRVLFLLVKRKQLYVRTSILV